MQTCSVLRYCFYMAPTTLNQQNKSTLKDNDPNFNSNSWSIKKCIQLILELNIPEIQYLDLWNTDVTAVVICHWLRQMN